MENQPQERIVMFEDGSQQNLYVTPLEGNLYRLEETPVFVEHEVFLGDIIEAEIRDDAVLNFRRVAISSPWRHWQWILSRTLMESAAFSEFKAMIEEQGGKWENVLGGLFIVHLPEESTFDPVVQLRACQ